MNKIFIGITEIAGYGANLKKGFLDNSIECVFINLSTHPFNYGGDDEPNKLIKIYKWMLKKKNSNESKWTKISYIIFLFTLRVLIFIWAITKYNVFIFLFGQSFFNCYDLPILKILNKKIIFVFMGSDGRPPYIAGAWLGKPVNELYKYSMIVNAKIQVIEHYSDVIITHPAYAHYHQKKYVKFLTLGLPFSFADEMPKEKNQSHNSIRILHSPSDRIAKGSNHIRKAITELQEKGYNIEFIEITGKPQKDVIEELENCDFVVDQIYSDTPLAGFATEAAWYGKPAIVGGYYSKYIQNDYAPNEIPPSVFCHPDEIRNAIERLIINPTYRMELGQKAQEFVRARWTPKQIAQKYLLIIKEDIPNDWIADPKNISYLQGGGIPQHRSKENIRALIECYGIQALCLSDKPNLEELFAKYAKS